MAETTHVGPESEFGLGRLVVADSRLVLLALNEVRYWSLNRVFGATREQANILTFVLALSAAEAAHQTARRVLHPPHVSGADAALSALAVREAAIAIAGPAAREMPLFVTVLTVGFVGSAGLRALQRAAHSLRIAERRARMKRIDYYLAAGRRLRPQAMIR
jgi:hypothetical protein